jgi:hypothetical protein
MWSDPIVSEVRAVRDAHARLHGYDLDRIFRDLKEQESRSGRKYVRLRSRRLPARPAKGKQP